MMKPDCIHLYRALAPHPNRQTGAAIFVVVLMSLVVSLMSIQLVNRLVLGNRDVILEQDVALARQAAEAALRDAEQDIRCNQWVVTTSGTAKSGSYQFVPNSARTSTAQQRPHCDAITTDATQSGALGTGTSCTKGYILKDPAATSVSRTPFSTTACQTVYGTITNAPAFNTGGVNSSSAYYTVEIILVPNGQVGQNIPYYRIRATGMGREAGSASTSSTQVTLESVFRPL